MEGSESLGNCSRQGMQLVLEEERNYPWKTKLTKNWLVTTYKHIQVWSSEDK